MFCALFVTLVCTEYVPVSSPIKYFDWKTGLENLKQADGVAALKEVIAAVPDEIPVLLDAKRGDIGTTAAAYASAAFEVMLPSLFFGALLLWCCCLRIRITLLCFPDVCLLSLTLV